MSIIEIDNLSPAEMIAQYVLECSERGHCLRYTDYEIIQEWLRAAPSPEELLLVLSDILPAYFHKLKEKSKTGSLRSTRLRVLRRLRVNAVRQSDMI